MMSECGGLQWLEENSDWIGLDLQVRYIFGRVDVVVLDMGFGSMHEI